MKNTLKNNFMQAAFGTMIWVALITRFTKFHPFNDSFTFSWNLIGIGVLAGAIFGVIYPLLWNYSTFKASTNIILSTLSNLAFQFLTVYLFSKELFDLIVKPYFLIIAVLTLIVHFISFYLYRKYENKKIAAELNQQLSSNL